MPTDHLGGGSFDLLNWKCDRRAVKWVVTTSVLEISLQARTHLQAIIACDCKIAEFEEPVDIGAKAETISNFVRAVLGEGFEVCGLERRK